MAKDYSGGGTGMRPIMDIWVYWHTQASITQDEMLPLFKTLGAFNLKDRPYRLSLCWSEGAAMK